MDVLTFLVQFVSALSSVSATSKFAFSWYVSLQHKCYVKNAGSDIYDLSMKWRKWTQNGEIVSVHLFACFIS